MNFKQFQVLKKYFDKVILVDYISHRCVQLKTVRQRKLYSKWIEESFTKWNCLDENLFGQFDKLLFIDADMLVKYNCDDQLFSLEPPAMTFSLPWAKPYQHNSGMSNPYGELIHGSRISRKTVLEFGFNSFVGLGSMALVKPDQNVFNQLKLCLCDDGFLFYGKSTCYSGFDEQLICQTYCLLGYQFTHIHQSYNWCAGKWNWLPNYKGPKDLTKLNKSDANSPKIFHYYGDEKPWFYSRNDQPRDTEYWWQLADEIIYELKDNIARKFFELDFI